MFTFDGLYLNVVGNCHGVRLCMRINLYARFLHCTAGSKPRIFRRRAPEYPGGTSGTPQTGAAGACSAGIVQAADRLSAVHF